MDAFEKLANEACEDGIDVIDYRFGSNRIKGLYCDGTIAVDPSLSTNERSCVLAEELGHHYTTHGDIIDLSVTENRKQERRARLWAYDKKIGLKKLIKSFEHGCRSSHEIAEFLEVTEEFLQEAVECYRQKYGVCTTVDDYYIMFIPRLMVGKMI